MKVVLISGKQGSGKSTLQSALAATCYLRRNLKFEKINFADVIYKIHDQALSVLAAHGIDRGIKKDGKLLQLLGTEWGRTTLGENVWVQCLQNRCKQLAEAGNTDLVVIADARFENEFDGFEDALRIRLVCAEEIRKERAEGWRDTTSHPSETSLDQYEAEGKFDLYFNTGVFDVNTIVEEILPHLMSDGWKNERTKSVPK